MIRNQALLEAIAIELKARRSVLKLSQEQLALRAGVNRTYVAKLELAKNQPTLPVLLELANALNRSLPDLVSGIMQRYSDRPRLSPEARARALQLPGEVGDEDTPLSTRLIDKITATPVTKESNE